MTAIGLMYEAEKEQYGAYRAATVKVRIVENKMIVEETSAFHACNQIGIGYFEYTEAKMVMKAYEAMTKEESALP